MYAAQLAVETDETAFREIARRALSREIAPPQLTFAISDATTLFPILPEARPGFQITVPRAYGELLQDAICHRAPDRFALLYETLWRLKHGEPELMSRASDPVIAKLSLYAKAVQRDIHKMHAFVRFHARHDDDGDIFMAWFEPDHSILRRAAPFFVDRFANMRWVIATPTGTAVWDKEELSFGPPGPKPENLEDGVLDEVWRTYYRAVFNPARLNVGLTTKEMPRKYWRNMPETALIPDLAAGANRRVSQMDRVPDTPPRFAAHIAARKRAGAHPASSFDALKAEALRCVACPLHRHATQAVFGEGPADARIVFVGEQPGDSEDLAGKPFVGPAGQMFDRALKEAGIDRAQTYVTNAVKHFKFEPRGKRRIHSRPGTAEIQVCRQWLFRELDLIDPDLVVALGATAAQALSGKALAVMKMRGVEMRWPNGRRGLITVHPSFLLRLPNAAAQAAEYGNFVADLRLAALIVEGLRGAANGAAKNAA